LPYAVRSSPPLCSEDTTTGGPDTESNLQHQRAPITSRRSTAVRPTEARVAPELGVGRSRHAIRHESGRVAVPQPAANTRPHVQQPGRPATTAAVVRRSRSAQGPVAARQQDRAGRQTASSAGRVWPDGLMRRQLKPPPGHPTQSDPSTKTSANHALVSRCRFICMAVGPYCNLWRTPTKLQPSCTSEQRPRRSCRAIASGDPRPELWSAAGSIRPGRQRIVSCPSVRAARSRMLGLWSVLVAAAPLEGERRW
jgi:hypothetical protein